MHRTLSELDSNVIQDYGDILHSQTAIPETIHFENNKELLKAELKKSFEDQTKGKSEQEIKKLLSKIKKSSDAQQLKSIQSQEAEFYVQEQLLKLGQEKNLPMVILRGVKTFQDIGRHLLVYGIELSKLRKS